MEKMINNCLRFVVVGFFIFFIFFYLVVVFLLLLLLFGEGGIMNSFSIIFS